MGCHGKKGIKASAWLLNCDWVGRAKSRGLSWPRFRVGSGRSNPSANVGFGCDAACFHPPNLAALQLSLTGPALKEKPPIRPPLEN